jgi:3-deoxy-D-manno-octulosonate 8-phosphate phosphatase (KDO 8-P phosphatase)
MVLRTQSEMEEKIGPIRLVVFDVDGTLTDGRIWLGGTGEFKVFHVLDGAGLKFLMHAGLEVALLSSRRSAAVEQRAAELGIKHLFQGVEAKGAVMMKLQDQLGLKGRQTASMGHDLPDLAMFHRSGLRMAVADSVPEICAQADWISRMGGGRGAAREAAETILQVQGHWATIVAAYQD